MNWIKAVQIFLLVLIIIGLGLIATQSLWVPKLVDRILQSENENFLMPTATSTAQASSMPTQAPRSVPGTSQYKTFYFSGGSANITTERNGLEVGVGEPKEDADTGRAVDMGDGTVRGFGVTDGICGLESCGFQYAYKNPGMYVVKLLSGAQCGEDGSCRKTDAQVIGTVSITVGGPQSTASVPGMSQYTDPEFGFSFWYPSEWLVSVTSAPDNRYTDSTYATEAKVLKTISIKDPTKPWLGVSINEVYSPSMSIYGDPLGDPSPVSSYENYFFDRATHTWMVATNFTPKGDPAATTTANVSNNTMGGLHIFSAYVRFGNAAIVPLSATNFVVIYDNYSAASENSVPGDPYTNFMDFVKTILATDPSVATPVSVDEQRQAVQAEKNGYILNQF